MSRVSAALAYLALFSIFAASTAYAQGPPPGNPISFTVDGGAFHQTNTDLDEGGDFEMDRWFLSAGVNYSWDRRNSIGFSVGGGKHTYDFNPESDFGGGDPWHKVNDFRLGVPMRFKVSEKASAIIVPTVRWNGESGADNGDSRSWGLFAAVAWRLHEGLTIGPGLGVFQKLEDGTRVFPLVAIDWDINERWNLGTGSGLAASQGPGLTLSYKASEHWTVALSGRYENLEFRLDEKGPAPGGIGKDKSFPLVVSGVVEPNEKVRLSLFAGAEFGGKLKLKDSFDELVDESSYDATAIIGATFAVRF